MYIRLEDGNGNVRVLLVCAKSRVATLKVQSLPRLELADAKLMVDLKETRSKCLIERDQTYYWANWPIYILKHTSSGMQKTNGCYVSNDTK